MTNFQDIIREVYDGGNKALKIVGNLSSNFAGNVTLDPGSKVQIVGNVTLSDPKGFIGLVTVVGSLSPATGNVTLDAGSKTQIVGNITLSDPKGFIGLVTVVGSLAPAAGNVTLDAGSKTQIVGNITLSDSKGYIGLVTVTQASAVRSLVGNVTLSDPKTGIGLVSIFGGSVGISGNVTLSDPKTFIGLVTAWTRNAGSAKTLNTLPIGLSQGSQATIAVPTNANTMYITNMILSSDATVRVNIKSGVTYLTGNVTLGITLNPGGGFIQTGAPDSPSWIGLPSGAIIVEKLDLTGTKANIGGSITYFQE